MAFKEQLTMETKDNISLGGTNKQTGRPNPTTIEGYYLGSAKIASQMSKTGFSMKHVLLTPNGTVGVWGKGNLDWRLDMVKIGTMIKIVQEGTRPTQKGSPMFLFKVFIDEDNTTDVSALTHNPVKNNAEQEDDVPYGAVTQDEVEDDDNLSPDEAPYVPPKAPRAPTPAPSASAQQNVKDRLKRPRIG